MPAGTAAPGWEGRALSPVKEAGTVVIKYVGVRELANRASALLDDLQGEPVVVTKHGRPVAVLSPIDEEAFADFVLDHAPEYVASRKAVEERAAAGDYGRPMDEVFAELDAEEHAPSA